MKRHFVRLGLGVMGLALSVIFAGVVTLVCMAIIGLGYLVFSFPEVDRCLMVTLVVLTACYFIGKDMEKKQP